MNKHFDQPDKSCYDYGCTDDCPVNLEAASIDAFVQSTVDRVRPRGTNAAVTLVMLQAARAAADAASRDKAGTIDHDQATRIFNEAVLLMAERCK